MDETNNNIPLGFAKGIFPESCHVCMIFDSEEQRQKIVSEYLATGLEQGEQVRFFTDVTSPEKIHSWLLEMGVHLPETKENGPFSISKAEKAYCPNGRFDPKAMLNGMVPRYDQAKKSGYSGVRSCGEMTWALKGIPGSECLLEYESLLNTLNTDYPHSGMCLYDARLFDGATLLNVLKVHPYMIANGQIVRNPYYIRPEEFLAEFKLDE